MSVALVILAAGASARLGACKALVDLGGLTPLQRLLAAGRVFDAAPPLVIGGAHAAEIARAVPPHAEFLANPAWAAGRSGGVALAASARPGSDLCLAPVDVPLVPAAVFDALREAWFAAGEPASGWLAPRCTRAASDGALHGHPIVIGRDLAAQTRVLGKEVPLRALRGSARPLLSIEVDAVEILDDLDTPADLERLRRRIS